MPALSQGYSQHLNFAMKSRRPEVLKISGSSGIFVKLKGLGLQRIKRKTEQQVFLSFVNSILVVLPQTLQKNQVPKVS